MDPTGLIKSWFSSYKYNSLQDLLKLKLDALKRVTSAEVNPELKEVSADSMEYLSTEWKREIFRLQQELVAASASEPPQEEAKKQSPYPVPRSVVTPVRVQQHTMSGGCGKRRRPKKGGRRKTVRRRGIRRRNDKV